MTHLSGQPVVNWPCEGRLAEWGLPLGLWLAVEAGDRLETSLLAGWFGSP